MNFRVRVKEGACYSGRGAAGGAIPVTPGGYRATLDLRESLFGPELVLTLSNEESLTRDGLEIPLAPYPDLWDFPRLPENAGLEIVA